MKKIEILSMGECLHCSKCKELIKRIKKKFPSLKVKEVDIAKSPDVLHKYNLMSIPAVVIDGKLKFLGIPSEGELKKIMEVDK